MYIGLSLLLLVIGAILHWGVSDSLEGVDLTTIGTILMVAGLAAFVISLIYDFAYRRRTAPAGAVEEERVVRRDDPRVY